MIDIDPTIIISKKEIYPACCSHLFVAPKNCYCCLKGCSHCTACKIDLADKKEKGEAS